MRQRGLQRAWRAVALVLALVMLAACAKGGSSTGGPSTQTTPGGTGTTEQKKGGRLTVARGASTDTLDPAATIVAASYEVFHHIYDTLVVRTADGYAGQIAERWRVSDDATEWFFTIREGLRFSNGNPVNADAVAFTFNRILDPATQAPSRAFVGPLERVEKVDELTVKFVLAQPYALMLDNLSAGYFGIVDPAAVAQYGDTFGRNPVGSGPFKLKEWVTGDRIVLVPNEYYKSFEPYVENKGKPYLDELVFRDIPQVETQIAAMQSGEANYMALPGDKAAQFENRPDFQVHKIPGGSGIVYLHFGMDAAADGMNKFRPPFDDIRVRQAVGYAVDTQAIIEHLLYGTAVRNATPMPTGNFGYDEGLSRYGLSYNPEKAKQLLDEAGWKVGPSGVREKNGQPLAVKYWSYTGDPEMAPVIQSQLTQVGFQIDMTLMDSTTVLSRIGDSDFQLNDLGVTWPFSSIVQIMATVGWGFGLYNDAEVMAALAQADTTADAAARKQLYVKAQQKILEDTALVPLYTPTGLLLLNSDVQNVRFGPTGGLLYQDLWVK